MNWTNVGLILGRELRDQLRDRRTLFTVVVLPLLLYPLMGISLMQITQFFREHPTRVWVVGQQNLAAEPAFFEGSEIAPAWLAPEQRHLLSVCISEQSDGEFHRLVSEFKRDSAGVESQELVNAYIQQELRRRRSDLAVLVPKPINSVDGRSGSNREIPGIYLFLNTSSDRSRVAAERFLQAADRWKVAVRDHSLQKAGLSPRLVEPFAIRSADISDQNGKRVAAWSRILPLLIMVWSLTGAFYPAVDLCAGEKERGTFETLLSSPASRDEIAIGKLLTVMIFSFVTCLLNLLSVGITSFFVVAGTGGAGSLSPLGAIELPPLQSLIWLILAMLPTAALFSALSLAAAAFARSSKEGQYYLVPLIMICLPLMAIPLFPATRLELGTSLLPVTGLILLLRSLIEGDFGNAIQFFAPVCLVTFAGCWLAIRWVVSQFNSETVLFRASERFSLRRWAAGTFLQRQDLPTAGQALLCGVTILLVKFFAGFSVGLPGTFLGFAGQTVVVLLATVLMPAVLMAMMLTRSPCSSLKIKTCRPSLIAAATLLAICLSPLNTWLSAAVMAVYPMNQSVQQLQEVLGRVLASAPSLPAIILILAVVPAVFEEFAFRGFILTGFQRMKSPLAAIALSSFFFALAHAVFQQSVLAFISGCLLGVVVWRTGSILPAIAYHAVHNSMSILLGEVSYGGWGVFRWLVYENEQGAVAYRILPGLMLLLVGLGLLGWLFRVTKPQHLSAVHHKDGLQPGEKPGVEGNSEVKPVPSLAAEGLRGG